MGKECHSTARVLLQPGIAAFGEWTVTGQLPKRMSLADVVQFLAGEMRLVEGDFAHFAPRVATTNSDPPAGKEAPFSMANRSMPRIFSSPMFSVLLMWNSANGW